MLAALTVLAAILAAPAAQLAPVGKVARLIPRADLTRAAKTIKLAENDAVAEQDRIRTAAGGRARITLNDGSILNVGSASELVVQSAKGASQASAVEMRYGRMRAWVSSRSGSGTFQVKTNTAVCGVLGTTIFVDASRDVTRIANVSDEPNARVRVTSSAGGITNEVILLPGEGTAVPANRPPQTPRRWTREEMQAAYDETNIP